MSLHRPKLISSKQGLGSNTSKQLRFINDNTAIGTEVWGILEKPWSEGDTIIAREGYVWITLWEVGKPYIITKFFDATHNLIAIYCDISRPVQRIGNGFEFEDMYLDVWQTPGNSPMILDENELAEALKAGFITSYEAEKAAKEAAHVVALLSDPKSDITHF